MIDGLMKRYIDPLWERMARPLVRAGLSPNQVTALGAVAVLVVSGAYILHQNELVLGLTLALAFAFDALDGAVARQRGMQTRTGGYFDAMVDRYQELAVLAALAWVNAVWAAAFFAFSGAVLTSYAKARTAIETPIRNEAWPDLFERLERIIYLCVLLVLCGATGLDWLLGAGLWVYAGICHFTALQRARRAVRLLRRTDREN